MRKFRRIFIPLILLLLIIFTAASVYLWRYRISLIENQAIPRLESIVGFSISGDVQGFDLVDGLVINNLALGPKDKPVLRAREAAVNISLLDVLKNQIFRQNLAAFEISSLNLTGAMVSARNTKDGKLLFFPESKDPNRGEREKEKDENISYWKINEIDIKDSTIEIEDRKTKKQISVSKINISIKNLGNNSLLEANGDLLLFIREFGIDSFNPDFEFVEAVHGLLKFKELDLFFTDQMALREGVINALISNLQLYYKSKKLSQDNLELKTRIENSSGLVLNNLFLKGTGSNFELKALSPVHIDKGLGNDWSFDFYAKDLKLADLAIFGLRAEGQGNFKLSSRATGSDFDLKLTGDIENLSGEFGDSRIQEPVNLMLQFDSSLPKSLDVIKDGFKIRGMLASISLKDEKLLDLAINSHLYARNSETKNFIKLHSSVLNIDSLQKLFVLGVKTDNEDSTNNKSDEGEDDRAGQAPAVDLRLSWPYPTTELEVDLANLSYHNYTIDNLLVTGLASHHQIDLDKIQVTKGSNQLSSSLSVKLNEKQDFRLKVNSERISFESLKVLYDELQNRSVSGSIKNLDLEASGTSSDTQALKKSLKADLKFNADDIYLPKELIDVVPFNLIFIPFTAVSAAFGSIPEEILPDRIIDAGTGIADAFRQVQTFKINQGDFEVKIEDEVVHLEEVRIGTSISGEVYFSGKLKFNKEIELNSGISLLGVRVPLPITGTIESPRPDIPQFVRGIFTEFGLSVVSLPVTFLKSVGGMFSSDKKLEKKSEKKLKLPEEQKSEGQSLEDQSAVDEEERS